MNKREEEKEATEREILETYIRTTGITAPITVTKAVQPDYILSYSNNLQIGVEITRMTTETDEVMKTIMRENHKTEENAKKIKRDAIEKHGQKASVYDYYRICGKFAMGSPVFNVGEKKKRFAEIVGKKYNKYKSQIQYYHEFIVLCDARFGIEISSDYDADDVFAVIDQMGITEPFTVAILYENNGPRCAQRKFGQ